MKFGLILVVTLVASECTPVKPEIMKQRQEVVDLCEARGGIPAISYSGEVMDRRDFPPIVTNPTVEKK